MDEEVIFPDTRLEATIRQAIDKPEGPISRSELEAITSLRYRPPITAALSKFISDLTGLEYCTNLTDLNLSRTVISDVSLLASLTNLTELNLWKNQITDISPLVTLTNLTEINLAANKITDISPRRRSGGCGTLGAVRFGDGCG